MRIRRGNPRAIHHIGISDLPPRIVGRAREDLHVIPFVQTTDDGRIGAGGAANAQAIGGHACLHRAGNRCGRCGEETRGGREENGNDYCQREKGQLGRIVAKQRHSTCFLHTRLNATEAELSVAFILVYNLGTHPRCPAVGTSGSIQPSGRDNKGVLPFTHSQRIQSDWILMQARRASVQINAWLA